MASGKQPGRLAQALAAAGNSGTYRPERGIYSCRGFGVIHALQSDKQNYQPLLLRQFGETAFQVAKLEPRSLIGREHQTRIGFLQFDTLGYGWDTGPGAQSSATPTGKSVDEGTTTAGSPSPIWRQPLSTSWASS